LDALRDRRLEHAHRAVLAELLEDMGSKNGKCWTLRETLAERLGMSVRTVNNVLYELRTWGYVCWEKLPNPLDDTKLTFHYTVALALKPRADLQADITRAVEALRKSTPRAVHTPRAVYTAGGVGKCPAGGVKKPATLITEPRKEPEETRAPQKGGTTQKSDPNDFERFWRAFPPGRKIDKGDCRDLFDKIVSGKHKTRRVSAEEIIAAVERYAATKPDPKYTPAVKTWLNGGRWEDDVCQPQPRKAANPETQLAELAASDAGKEWIARLGPEAGMQKLRDIVANATKGGR
jgi:hypothetical protein